MIQPQKSHVPLSGAALGCLLLLACGGDVEKAKVGGTPSKAGGTPSKLAVTADWINGTLSYVDLAAIQAGKSTKSQVVTRQIDLSSHTPGPLALELTHDKKRLIVSLSAGFFAIPGAGLIINEQTIPMGPGSLMVFDVESGEQLADIATGDGPMGVAVTPDDKRAFVAHFGSGDIAVVDLTSFEVLERVNIGQFPEEIAFDDSGEVGIVGYSSQGSVRTFATDDLTGSLSDVPLQGDSAGVAFFPGSKVAYVVQAPNPISPSSGYTLVDVADPRAPLVIKDVRMSVLNVAYPAIAAPARGTILVPITKGGKLLLEEYRLQGDDIELTQSLEVGAAGLLSAVGLSYDGADTVLMALTSERALAATDLKSGESRIIPWEQKRAGPSDVIIR